MKKKQVTICLAAMCTILGVISGVQYNTVKSQAQTTENVRLSELSASLQQIQQQKDALQVQVEQQESLLKEYESGNIDSPYIQQIRQQYEQLCEFAGLTTCTGKGIVVTMKDSTLNMGGDPNAYIIHAEDILKVVNELWVAGATAVSVNEQRIVSTTGITCAGSIITINGVRIAAPFEVKALGDASVLQGALKFPGGIVDSLSPWGITIDIKENDAISIPAYTQTSLWTANQQIGMEENEE